jgi:hypothetical protein
VFRLDNNATTMSREETPQVVRDHGQRPTLRKRVSERVLSTPQDEINERWPAEENCLNCWR